MKGRAVLFGIVLGCAFPVYAGKPASEIPAMAPGFELPGRADSVVSLQSLRGKVVYVDFWASWCGPCRESFPWMEKLHRQYSAKGLVIVGINLDKNRQAANDFLDENPASFLIAFDPAGRAAEAFNVPAMPSSYLIGPTGAILWSRAGFTMKEAAATEARIKEALSP